MRLADTEELFGPTVAGMVADGPTRSASEAWKPPAADEGRHLAHMRVMAPESVLVGRGQDLVNLTDLVDDLERDGDAALAGFNSSPDQMRAYYTAADAVLAPRLGGDPVHQGRVGRQAPARPARGVRFAGVPPGEDAVGWFLVATGAAPGVGPLPKRWEPEGSGVPDHCAPVG